MTTILSNRLNLMLSQKMFVNAFKKTQVKTSISIVEGMEYHYGRILQVEKDLAGCEKLENDNALDFEAIAYLNQVGRFYYFARNLRFLHLIPKINNLILIRHKEGAHRAIDCRQGETDNEVMWIAECFRIRTFTGKVPDDYDPDKNRIEEFLTPKRYNKSDAFISYQVICQGQYTTFTPREDHRIIMEEIEKMYEAACKELSG